LQKKYYVKTEVRRVTATPLAPEELEFTWPGDNSIKWLYGMELRNDNRPVDGLMQIADKIRQVGATNLVFFSEALVPVAAGLTEHIGVWTGIMAFNQRILAQFYNCVAADICTAVINYLGEG